MIATISIYGDYQCTGIFEDEETLFQFLLSKDYNVSMEMDDTTSYMIEDSDGGLIDHIKIIPYEINNFVDPYVW